MMNRSRFALAVVLLVTAVTGLNAARAGQGIVDVESRRRAAETAVRDIKSRGGDMEAARNAYTSVAARHNAWLDAVVRSVQDPQSPAANDEALAADAAASFFEWFTARSHTLGAADIAPRLVPSMQEWIVATLQTTVADAWKKRGGNDARRQQAAANLNSRLRWKSWDDIR